MGRRKIFSTLTLGKKKITLLKKGKLNHKFEKETFFLDRKIFIKDEVDRGERIHGTECDSFTVKKLFIREREREIQREREREDKLPNN